MGEHQDISNHTSYRKCRTYFPETLFMNKSNDPASIDLRQTERE
jgi:hypothetical protein